MGERYPKTRKAVFDWAAKEVDAGRHPSLMDMARFGDRPKSTIQSWIRRHEDPRAERGMHSTAYGCIPPGTPMPSDAPEAAPAAYDPPEPARTCHFPGLPPRQEQAILLKAAGHRHTAIADALQVDRHTIAGWFRLPAVAAALSELRAEQHIAAREALTALGQDAIEAQRLALSKLVGILKQDVAVLCPSDRLLLESGERVTLIARPSDQIAAIRALNQTARLLMDRSGFHPKAELHLTGGGEDGGVTIDGVPLHELGDDDLEDDWEAEHRAILAEEAHLRVLDGGG